MTESQRRTRAQELWRTCGINRYKRSKQGEEATKSSSWLLDSESGLYVENVGLTDTRLVSKQGENSFVSFYLELYNQWIYPDDQIKD